MIKQVRIYLAEEAHKAAKSAAAQEGITLAAWIESAIKEKLDKEQRTTKKEGKKAT